MQVYKKVQDYTLFEQTTEVNVNKLLHSTYGVSVTQFDLNSLTVWHCRLYTFL